MKGLTVGLPTPGWQLKLQQQLVGFLSGAGANTQAEGLVALDPSRRDPEEICC